MSRRPREPSSRNRRFLLTSLFSLGLGLGASGRADAQENDAITRPVELHHDRRIDLPVTAALAAGWVGIALGKNGLTPDQCRWCDGSGTKVNGFDDWGRSTFRREDTRPAAVASDVLGWGVVPIAAGVLTALGSITDQRDGTFDDVHLMLQGVLAAMVVSESLKPIAARPRPYAHAIADAELRERSLSEAYALQSFPSSHTAAAFAFASASGTIASMRGYRLAPVIWASGLLLGVVTGYTRLASDQHYLTDVLTGAAIGFVVGGGVPWVFHRPYFPHLLEKATIAPAPVRGGTVATVSFVF